MEPRVPLDRTSLLSDSTAPPVTAGGRVMEAAFGRLLSGFVLYDGFVAERNKVACFLRASGVTSARIFSEAVSSAFSESVAEALDIPVAEINLEFLAICIELKDSVERLLPGERLLRRALGEDGLSDIIVVEGRRKLRRLEERFSREGVQPGPVAGRKPVSLRLPAAGSGGDPALRAREDKAALKWHVRLSRIFEEADTPSWRLVNEAQDKQAAIRSLIGASRPATVRLRVRAWEAFSAWLRIRFDVGWPRDVVQVFDYIHEQVDIPCASTFPISFGAALNWMEARAGIPFGERLGSDDLVRQALGRAKQELEGVTRQTRKAPRFLTIMIASLELEVMSENVAEVRRFFGWVRLLKIFGALRWDDVQRLCPDDLVLLDSGLSSVMKRTKTSGVGRRVRELPLFVSRDFSVVGTSWLQTGFELFVSKFERGRDYLVPRVDLQKDTFGCKPIRDGDAAALGRVVLDGLRTPYWNEAAMTWGRGEDKLLDGPLAAAWSGHSERATLPSILAASGIGKEARDLVGRWRAEGSDEYIRTYKAMAKNICLIFVESCGKGVFGTFDEEDALHDVVKALHWKGMEEKDIEEYTLNLKVKAKKFSAELVKYRASVLQGASASSSSVSSAARCIGSALEVAAAQPLDDEGPLVGVEGSPVIRLVVSESDRGRVFRLHRHDGCWRARQRAFTKFAEYTEAVLPPTEYNLVCADCFRAGGLAEADVAESGSSSSSTD